MRKSLGSKRQEIGEADIKLITRTFGDFAAIEPYELDKDDPDEDAKRGRPATKSKKKADKKTFGSKIFESHEFGYRRISIERPAPPVGAAERRAHRQLRFASGSAERVMQAVYAAFGQRLVRRNLRGPRAAWKPRCGRWSRPTSGPEGEAGQGAPAPKTWTAQLELLRQGGACAGRHWPGSATTSTRSRRRSVQALKKTGRQARHHRRDEAAHGRRELDEPGRRAGGEEGAQGEGSQPDVRGLQLPVGRWCNSSPTASLRDNEDVPLTEATARGADVERRQRGVLPEGGRAPRSGRLDG
jgi:type I restriction enzyme M protein